MSSSTSADSDDDDCERAEPAEEMLVVAATRAQTAWIEEVEVGSVPVTPSDGDAEFASDGTRWNVDSSMTRVELYSSSSAGVGLADASERDEPMRFPHDPHDHPDHDPGFPGAFPHSPECAKPSPEPTPYVDHETLLSDELTRIDLRMKAYLLRQRSAAILRAREGSAHDAFPAACRGILSHSFAWFDDVVEPSCAKEIRTLRSQWEAADRHVTERLRITPDSVRARMPVWRLTRKFGLVPNLADAMSSTDTVPHGTRAPRQTLRLDLLLLALLVDRSPRYRAAIEALPAEDGTVPGRLAAEVALQMVQDQSDPRNLEWDAVSPGSSLIAESLIQLEGSDEGSSGHPAHRAIHIDERIADYLLGRDAQDPLLTDFTRLVKQRHDWDRLRLDATTIRSLRALSELWWKKRGRRAGAGSDAPAWPEGLVLLLHGPAGSPFLPVVQTFLTPEGQGQSTVLVVDLPKAVITSKEHWITLVSRCYREATLRGCALLWQGWEVLVDGPGVEASGRAEAVIARAEQTAVPTFISSAVAWDPSGAFQASSRVFARVELRLPPEETRRLLWKDRLAALKHPTALDDTPEKRASLDLLASFVFTEGQIDDALTAARGLVLVSPGYLAGPMPSNEQLFEGCRRVAARRLVSFTRRISTRPGRDSLDALIVAPDVRQQLEELSGAMQHLHDVHDRLGFEHRLALGRGLIALFSGPSGTGKTMAATALAGRVRRDLYKVDLASIVSKYVGETEKNLSRVFADAQDANAVLFFDEADALFGKRGEVEGGQDRWANLEVNYLLQRVEEYTGTVILATNHRHSIDSAFQRRVQILVSFVEPKERERLAILRGMFPNIDAGASRRVLAPPEADLKRIADTFDHLSGGNLKNIVLDAVFRAVSAAEEGDRPIQVTVEQLVLGVAREYQKLNRQIAPAKFGREWFDMVVRELKLDRSAAH